MVDCTRLCFFVGFSSVFVWAVGCMSICRCIRFHLELFGTGVRLRRKLFGLMRCLLVFCLCFLGCLLVVVGGGCSVDGSIEVCCLVL